MTTQERLFSPTIDLAAAETFGEPSGPHVSDGTGALRTWLRRRGLGLTLSQRFLLAASIIVIVAMLGLGKLIETNLTASIVSGIGSTAVSSLDALIANELTEIGSARPLSAEDRATLDEAFSVANNAESTKLLQIRIWDLGGDILYQSLGDILDPDRSAAALGSARHGVATSRLANLPLAPVGPLVPGFISTLKIVTPIHDPGTARIIAVAELYYSAKTLNQLQHQAELEVWAAVGAVGACVIGGLLVLVSVTGRTIASQRQRIEHSLTHSQRLTQENILLRAASERLRHEANIANERLLSQVGSDLHDGPLQLLALLILKLSKPSGGSDRPADPDATTKVALARDAMEELRNISAGLALPELADATLEQAISLAIARHTELTGTRVSSQLEAVPADAPMDVRVCAYRVVQEALTNAYRHSEDRSPSVTVTGEGNLIRIVVANEASPAPLGEPREGSGLGLAGMRFRVKSLGGELRLETSPGGTVRLCAELPIEPVQASTDIS